MLNIVNEYLNTQKGQELLNTLNSEYESKIIYPKRQDLFKAFSLCEVPKVIIIGQDPYHDGSADGLAFSSSIKTPPSLKNIFKEILNDYPNEAVILQSDLSYLAKQGVALLNASLSVQKGKANSHKHLWEDFFTYVIRRINDDYNDLVFMLWGKFANDFAGFIDTNKHLILSSAHPSPLARGKFFNNQHFLKCNEFLKSKNIKEISWLIPNSNS